VVGTLLCVLPASAQPTAIPTQSLAWTYQNASAQLVDRFEVSYDDGAWTGAGLQMVTGVADLFFAPLPALITGTHTVRVRACNAAGCSDPSDVFTFRMVAGVPIMVNGPFSIIETPPQ